jgi:hypothetical protein
MQGGIITDVHGSVRRKDRARGFVATTTDEVIDAVTAMNEEEGYTHTRHDMPGQKRFSMITFKLRGVRRRMRRSFDWEADI